MYVPAKFKVEDAELFDAIKANSFATLISHFDDQFYATHTPLILSEDKTYLLGHISKGNAHKNALRSGQPVLAVFQGPHAYISPRWYTEMNVPTWNYVAVHVTGTPEILNDGESAHFLRNLVDIYEKPQPNPVTWDEIPEPVLQMDLRGIVSFKILITKLEGALKMSQNRDDESYTNIIQNLRASDNADSKATADVMQKIKRPKE